MSVGAPLSCSAPDTASSESSFGSTGSGGATVRRGSATSTSGKSIKRLKCCLADIIIVGPRNTCKWLSLTHSLTEA